MNTLQLLSRTHTEEAADRLPFIFRLATHRPRRVPEDRVGDSTRRLPQVVIVALIAGVSDDTQTIASPAVGDADGELCLGGRRVAECIVFPVFLEAVRDRNAVVERPLVCPVAFSVSVRLHLDTTYASPGFARCPAEE
ncbi:unnamed protein product [Ectocarpus sp. 13 AM-2016]